MKGLYGFNFALLIIAAIAWFYTYRQLQETQQKHTEQLKIVRQEAYYQCKEEANNQLQQELEYAKRNAREEGYNLAVTEYRKKADRAYHSGYEKGQADTELSFNRRIFQMEQTHHEKILRIKAYYEKKEIEYQRLIQDLELEKEQLISNCVDNKSAPKQDKVALSNSSQIETPFGIITQEQRSLNYAVLHAIWMLPFLAAMIQGIVRRNRRRWKL